MGTPPEEFEEWAHRVWAMCGDDVECVIAFLRENVAWGATPETQQKIMQALAHNALYFYSIELVIQFEQRVFSDPALAKHWRPIFTDAMIYAVWGRALGMTWKELSKVTGIAEHTYWNMAWLARKSGIAWPRRP